MSSNSSLTITTFKSNNTCVSYLCYRLFTRSIGNRANTKCIAERRSCPRCDISSLYNLCARSISKCRIFFSGCYSNVVLSNLNSTKINLSLLIAGSSQICLNGKAGNSLCDCFTCIISSGNCKSIVIERTILLKCRLICTTKNVVVNCKSITCVVNLNFRNIYRTILQVDNTYRLSAQTSWCQ